MAVTDVESAERARIRDIILQQHPGSIVFKERPWGLSHWGFFVNPLCTDQEIRDDIKEEITEFRQ